MGFIYLPEFCNNLGYYKFTSGIVNRRYKKSELVKDRFFVLII